MAQSATPASGLASRYASSLFDLAREAGEIERVERDLSRFDAMVAGSDDLRRLVRSPVFSSDDQTRAVAAVLDRAGISGLTANFIRVVAANRRLFAMPDMLTAFRQLLARHRGETAATVTVAEPLTERQREALKRELGQSLGKDVAITEVVDPTILGGLIVKVGSRQVDTSLRTRLGSLKLALKEVG